MADPPPAGGSPSRTARSLDRRRVASRHPTDRTEGRSCARSRRGSLPRRGCGPRTRSADLRHGRPGRRRSAAQAFLRPSMDLLEWPTARHADTCRASAKADQRDRLFMLTVIYTAASCKLEPVWESGGWPSSARQLSSSPPPSVSVCEFGDREASAVSDLGTVKRIACRWSCGERFPNRGVVTPEPAMTRERTAGRPYHSDDRGLGQGDGPGMPDAPCCSVRESGAGVRFALWIRSPTFLGCSGPEPPSVRALMPAAPGRSAFPPMTGSSSTP